MNNRFVWTDLSSYYPSESCTFYQEFFHWNFKNVNEYYLAFADNNLVAGIYETPSFFKEIKMPHFWMNYIKVQNLSSVTEKAKQLGGKVELENAPFYDGHISLIRDPLGAGFTVYEGQSLLQPNNTSQGSVIYRELHISSFHKIEDFYSSLFGWKFKVSTDSGYDIYHNAELIDARILEISPELKGKYEYWVSGFKVNNLDTAIRRLKALKGSIVYQEASRVLVTDLYGEAFFYIQE